MACHLSRNTADLVLLLGASTVSVGQDFEDQTSDRAVVTSTTGGVFAVNHEREDVLWKCVE